MWDRMGWDEIVKIKIKIKKKPKPKIWCNENKGEDTQKTT